MAVIASSCDSFSSQMVEPTERKKLSVQCFCPSEIQDFAYNPVVLAATAAAILGMVRMILQSTFPIHFCIDSIVMPVAIEMSKGFFSKIMALNSVQTNFICVGFTAKTITLACFTASILLVVA